MERYLEWSLERRLDAHYVSVGGLIHFHSVAGGIDPAVLIGKSVGRAQADLLIYRQETERDLDKTAATEPRPTTRHSAATHPC